MRIPRGQGLQEQACRIEEANRSVGDRLTTDRIDNRVNHREAQSKSESLVGNPGQVNDAIQLGKAGLLNLYW